MYLLWGKGADFTLILVFCTCKLDSLYWLQKAQLAIVIQDISYASVPIIVEHDWAIMVPIWHAMN